MEAWRSRQGGSDLVLTWWHLPLVFPLLRAGPRGRGKFFLGHAYQGWRSNTARRFELTPGYGCLLFDKLESVDGVGAYGV